MQAISNTSEEPRILKEVNCTCINSLRLEIIPGFELCVPEIRLEDDYFEELKDLQLEESVFVD